MKYAIFDLDGTVSNCSWRSGFAERAEGFAERGLTDAAAIAWRDFHNYSVHDTLHEDVASIIRAWAAAGHGLLYVTGRPEAARSRTEQWLTAWELPFTSTHLFMRPDDSTEHTPAYKRAVLQFIRSDIIQDGDELLFAIDDDDRCVVMYRENDLVCLQPRTKQY